MQIKITDEKGIYSSHNIIHFIREKKKKKIPSNGNADQMGVLLL